MAKIITVIVDRQGETKISGEGFKGTECLQATADLESAYGAVVGAREPHSEMYETEAQTQLEQHEGE